LATPILSAVSELLTITLPTRLPSSGLATEGGGGGEDEEFNRFMMFCRATLPAHVQPRQHEIYPCGNQYFLQKKSEINITEERQNGMTILAFFSMSA